MLILGGNQLAGGYEVDNSLRFDDGSSDYLYRIGGTATDGKKFTYSAWFKRSEIGGGNELFCIYSSNTNRLFLRNNGDTFELVLLGGFGSTTRQFRDPSAWYHFVIACDSTQATASDRGKWYLNGELIMTGSISLNQVFPHGQSTPYFIIGNGRYNGAFYTQYWDGYQSEVCFIDGQQLDPTSFGEFDEDSGIWKPIDVSGLTFGNNGFYLPFENSAALGQDDSGNGNNFTVNNLTSIDQTTDTPTNNFATFNPLSKNDAGTVTFSNGNLTTAHTGTDSRYTSYSTLAVTQGKWYAEFKYDASSGGSDMMVGIGDLPEVENLNRQGNRLGQAGNTVGYYSGDGFKYVGPSDTASAYGNTYTVGDIIGVALDLDNGYVYFSKNGVWQNSGDPESGASGTGGISFITGNPFIIASSHVTTSSRTTTYSGNYGNPPFSISSGNSDGNGYGNFEYSVPSGYYALNTKNLAEYG